MYEIVVRFRHREEVIETADTLETALARVQVYERQGLTAYFRSHVRRALVAKSAMEVASRPNAEPVHSVDANHIRSKTDEGRHVETTTN